MIKVCQIKNIRKEAEMTANQIRYQEHLETKRANLAREAETKRDNEARLNETIRYNTIFTGETAAHNRAMEQLQAQANALNDAHYNRMDSETVRANQAKEAEQHRSNVVNERVAKENATTNRSNSIATRQNANTNEAIAEKQWGINSSLPGIAQKNFNLEKSKLEFEREKERQRIALARQIASSEAVKRAADILNMQVNSELRMWDTALSPANALIRGLTSKTISVK